MVLEMRIIPQKLPCKELPANTSKLVEAHKLFLANSLQIRRRYDLFTLRAATMFILFYRWSSAFWPDFNLAGRNFVFPLFENVFVLKKVHGVAIEVIQVGFIFRQVKIIVQF